MCIIRSPLSLRSVAEPQQHPRPLSDGSSAKCDMTNEESVVLFVCKWPARSNHIMHRFILLSVLSACAHAAASFSVGESACHISNLSVANADGTSAYALDCSSILSSITRLLD